MRPLHLRRGGTYYRVCDPGWTNPADTSFSKRYGGRWNPPGEFGALYLNASIPVAAANARRSLQREFGNAVTFADLRPERRPNLQLFIVSEHAFVDAFTSRGLAALELPDSYPRDVTHAQCRRIARKLYEANQAGIVPRSAALASGEELAIFDSYLRIARRKPRGLLAFDRWYPGLA